MPSKKAMGEDICSGPQGFLLNENNPTICEFSSGAELANFIHIINYPQRKKALGVLLFFHAFTSLIGCTNFPSSSIEGLHIFTIPHKMLCLVAS